MPDGEAVLEAGRDGVRELRPHLEDREQQEDDARDEDRAEALFPRGAQGDEAEGDEGVLAHVGRHGDGPVRVEPHQERAERRREDGGHRARPDRDAGRARIAGFTTMM